jgi:hypothetical protein
VAGTDETTRNTQEREPPEFERFALANAVFLVSSIGAFAYFVSRAAQTSFYSKFALEPEAVGLGYAETLSRAAPALLVLTSIVGLIASLWVRPWRRGQPHRKRRSGPWARLVIASIVCSLLVLAVWMPFAYDRRADDVKKGKPVRPPGLSTPLRLVTNPLGLRVVPMLVSWTDETRAAYDFRGEVMYLGRADGIAVFLDPTNQRTVHVPQNDIVLERKG